MRSQRYARGRTARGNNRVGVRYTYTGRGWPLSIFRFNERNFRKQPSLPLPHESGDDIFFSTLSYINREKRFHLAVFTPRRGGKKFFSPLFPLLFSTTHSNRANSPTNTTNISLNDRCNRVAMYLSCYESEREFCRSEIESKFSRTANKVCESMRTERYIQRRREEERWRERRKGESGEGKVER